MPGQGWQKHHAIALHACLMGQHHCCGARESSKLHSAHAGRIMPAGQGCACIKQFVFSLQQSPAWAPTLADADNSCTFQATHKRQATGHRLSSSLHHLNNSGRAVAVPAAPVLASALPGAEWPEWCPAHTRSNQITSHHVKSDQISLPDEHWYQVALAGAHARPRRPTIL